jgi:hypothetical protein
MNLHKLIGEQLLKVLSHLPGAAQEIAQKEYLKLVREVVCYNQGKISDYSFLVNERHKQLKICYRRIQNDPDSAQDSDYENLKNAYRDMSNGLLRQFKTYAHKNFMGEFYKTKNFNDKQPRFCIKSAAPDGNNSGDGLDFEIITLAGSIPPFRESPAYSARESAGFSQVISTGQYCLCNNIPKSIKSRQYFNSRIDEYETFTYYKIPGRAENLKYRFTSQKDTEWERCWRKDPSVKLTNGASSSHYKSTLIVPLSLSARSGDLSEEFLRNFNVQKEKIILGFLCADHENINFFNEKADIDFAYIVADQLSLYLIPYWVCTTYSGIFEDSYNLLMRQGCLN